MLQSSDHDARVKADMLGKHDHGIFGFQARKIDNVLSGNHVVTRPLVCFVFFGVIGMAGVGVVQKNRLLVGLVVCMQQDVRRFVEECEPELVVGFTVQRQLN